jgi:SAM-dependent methyltransferase
VRGGSSHTGRSPFCAPGWIVNFGRRFRDRVRPGRRGVRPLHRGQGRPKRRDLLSRRRPDAGVATPDPGASAPCSSPGLCPTVESWGGRYSSRKSSFGRYLSRTGLFVSFGIGIQHFLLRSSKDRAVQQQSIWDEETARNYDTPGTGMFSPDVVGPVVERLAGLAGNGRALEFAIGTGRIAVPLSEKSVAVVGIETSREMVDQLRSKSDENSIPVIIGDMATATAPGSYALVYLVYNTISNLLTQAEQVACFRNAARHLTPGGRFVIELWVPELRRLPPTQEAVVWQTEPGYIGLDTYDVVRQHVVSHHFRFDEGRGATLMRSPHRYIWPAELDLMGQLAGFELESRHADWLGAEFTAESRSHVSVYRLPEQ